MNPALEPSLFEPQSILRPSSSVSSQGVSRARIRATVRHCTSEQYDQILEREGGRRELISYSLWQSIPYDIDMGAMRSMIIDDF
jgi:hypothetical protein